ncbi:MAG: hypothetical protein IMY71_07175 [Bacteroidetes bacterium]|nr:hypothetical protein [Bacteroidota bacterium]
MRLRKLIIRIVLWFLLFSSLSIATFITNGYFVASKPVSYLPEMRESDLVPQPSGVNQIELKRSWYELFVYEDGRVTIKTLKGEVILSSLTYYSSYEGVNDDWGLDNISVMLTSDSTISIIGEGPFDVLVRILLTAHNYIPKLDVNIKTIYSKNTIVRREALVAAFDVKTSEVYRKNRQVDVESFDSEYWLQQQGLRFGSGYRSALIYHTPFVSSLQLDTKRNLLFVNLEYYLDHPYIRIPFQEDGGGRWVDLSTAKYIAGEERNNNFSIYFGGFPKVTPRIMLVPNGYLAGYVFTEHADGGNIRTHRAAYFGSEDISSVDDALGGFVGHKIPVTKSVFYADPGGPPGTSGTSIRDDPDWPQFLDFLDQLNETGDYDICLHTPDESNSNRELLEESIKFMKGRYDASTWIDHGMYSGKINRECFICDGLNPGSEYYTADLWEKYKTRYFWSSAVEEIRKYSLKENIRELRLYDASVNLWKRYMSPKELNEMRFYTAFREMVSRYQDKGELNSLKPNKGNGYPTPLFWQHPSRTSHFYSWVTDYDKQTNDLSSKKIKVEQKLLNKLISDWGIFINHGYFVRNGYHDDVLSERNGKIVINPYFDKILELMAQMRDERDLYITTIRDLLDYWVLIENVSFTYMPNGVIYINNYNEVPIKGLSLALHANQVWINGEVPKLRKIGKNTIFWFDIPAKQNVYMQVELY